MERSRSLGHVALAVGPGDGPAAADLLSALGLSVTDNGPSKQGDPWYTAVVDPSTFEGLENLFFVVPTSDAQRRLEAAIVESVDLDEFAESKVAGPESASHVALAYRSLDDLVAAAAAAAALDRVTVRVFRARRGLDDDVDAAMEAHPLLADAADEAFVPRTVQVFVQTDLVATGLLCLGQTIELDHVFPDPG